MRPAKPYRCACGRLATVKKTFPPVRHYLVCRRPWCWTGPWRRTRHDAIAAWNRTMRAHAIQRVARKHMRDYKRAGADMAARFKDAVKKAKAKAIAEKNPYFYAKRKYVSKAKVGK